MYTRPPETLEICGKSYRINTDFRVWLDFQKRTEGKTDAEIVAVVQDFLKSMGLPVNDESFKAALSFYSGGKSGKSGANAGKSAVKSVDFEKDEALIFAAFMAQYRVNLRTDILHWWDFLAMFSGLSDEHVIVKIIGIRTMDTSRMPPEQKRFYDELKQQYALGNYTPAGRYATLEERDKAFLERIRARAKEVGQYHE